MGLTQQAPAQSLNNPSTCSAVHESSSPSQPVQARLQGGLLLSALTDSGEDPGVE